MDEEKREIKEIDPKIWAKKFTTEEVTEAQFEGIRELLFRGESDDDIAKISGRSKTVIDIAKRTDTWETFRQVKRDYWIKVKDRAKTKPYTPKQDKEALPRERYARLDVAKKRFDEIVTGFIVEEIRATYGDMVNKIQELEKTNARLLEENQELKDQAFPQSLKQAIHEGIKKDGV